MQNARRAKVGSYLYAGLYLIAASDLADDLAQAASRQDVQLIRTYRAGHRGEVQYHP